MKPLSFIRSKLPEFIIDDDTILLMVDVRNMDPDMDLDTSNPEDLKKLEIVYLKCLLYILRLPTSISQGGFSLSSIDRATYKAEANSIIKKYDLESEEKNILGKPDITNAGEWI